MSVVFVYDSILSKNGVKQAMTTFGIHTLSAAFLAFGITTALASDQARQTETTMKITGQQGALSVIEAGTAGELPLLFLHADCGRATQWQGVLDTMAGERKVYALDFRGNGASEPAANGDYGYGGRVEDIASAVAALGLTRFGLVAHSGSAGAALDYAHAHEDAVAAIFLLDPATDPRLMPADIKEGYVAAMRAEDNYAPIRDYYASIAGSDAKVRDEILADCKASHPRAREGAAEGLAYWNPDPSFDGWKGPLFIMASPVTDNPASFFATRAGIAHKVAEGTAHWLQMEKPRMVAEEIRAFFDDKE